MKRFAWLVVGSLAACVPEATGTGKPTTWSADTSLGLQPSEVSSIADRYREPAARIIAAARASRGAYSKLTQLTDRIGHRLSGSPALDRAIAWAVKTLEADGHDARTEKVMVPHWVRGAEAAELVTPVARPLRILGLGGTIGTPKGGLTAPVVVVHSWDELEAKRETLKGAIVLYDVAMPAWSEATGSGYGDVVGYRSRGAMRAAKHGAVAVLVRSVTARSFRSPHTGHMRYVEGTPKIPAAAVTVEDSALIARLAATGPVTVHLSLDAQLLPDAASANVIGELRGRERPEEIVVIAAHLDSWDVGQGAHDDGAGVVMMMQALTTLRTLGLVPRRTVRVVLFTNEENGVRGSTQYAADHAAELANTVLALEADSGGFAPRGFMIGQPDETDAKTIPDTSAKVEPMIRAVTSLLRPIGATRVRVIPGDVGTDIAPMAAAGVPQIGLWVDTQTYFDYHHSEADTLDKVNPAELADDVAAVAVLAYIAADMPERPAGPPPTSPATPARK